MAEHLKYIWVTCTMVFIIGFTIFCEKSLARTKKWLTYFNPLLTPLLENVVSRLMILGATAFGLTVANEVYENDELTDYGWYATLHWIQTTIFIFALIYVLCTAHILGLMGLAMRIMAQTDVLPVGVLLAAADDNYLERAAADFKEAVRITMTTFHATTDVLSNALPHTVLAIDHLTHNVAVDAVSTELRTVEELIRQFLTSEDIAVEIEVTSEAFHSIAAKLVRPLVMMSVITHTYTVNAEGEITHIQLSKNPREQWNLLKEEEGDTSPNRSRHPSYPSSRMVQLMEGNGKRRLQQQEKRIFFHRTAITVQICYHLVKHYFLRTFFPKYLETPIATRVDFVYYVEVVMSYGVISSFNIGVREWFCLFLVTVPVVVDFDLGSMHIRNYELFTAGCVFLLLTAILATVYVSVIFRRILQDHYSVDVSSITSLQIALEAVRAEARAAQNDAKARAILRANAAATATMTTTAAGSNGNGNGDAAGGSAGSAGSAGSSSASARKSRRAPTAYNKVTLFRALVQDGDTGQQHSPYATKRDKFYENMVHNSHRLFELSHGLSLSDASTMKKRQFRSGKKAAVLWGITLTEFRLRKFIQLQLLVQSYYLSVFLCTYVGLHIDGKLPIACFIVPLVTLLLNLLMVTPCTLFLGYGLAAIINTDDHALHVVSRLASEGTSVLFQLKMCLLQDMHTLQEEDPSLSEKQHLETIFEKWAAKSREMEGLSEQLRRAESGVRESNTVAEQLKNENETQAAKAGGGEEGGNEAGKVAGSKAAGGKSTVLLTAADLRLVLIDWAYEHISDKFELPRPRLLAMVRLIDVNRNGIIDFAEFKSFYASAVRDREQERKVAETTFKKWRRSSKGESYLSSSGPGDEGTTNTLARDKQRTKAVL
jgi:hypothetical protein